MSVGLKNVFLAMLLLSMLFIYGNAFDKDDADDIVGRYQFPDGFLFGVSTSAYQIEGAIHEDGKGLSNWDAFVHRKGTIPNGDTGDIADDHYHRYFEDIENLQSLGVDAYRFSISWPRVLPISTSAYQIEGAIHEDGKGLSNWDAFVHRKGTIPNGDTGDIADDHYHRYFEDIENLQSLGVDAYRFSISWPRVLPRGKFGSVNPAGIAFYNTIIDKLLLKGIQPFITIHHNDHPQELEDRYGGWLSPLMQEDFTHFAETCFKNFGDRVKYWMTINEPGMVAELAYMRGVYSPGRCSPPFGNCTAGNSDLEPLIVMHNMLLGHAKAAKLYRDQFQLNQGGLVGIALNAFMYEPLTDDEHDRDAANRAMAFYVAWTSDPLVFGDYPPEMHHYLGNALPKFTSEETELVKNSIDFIGINHYTTMYAKDCIYSSCDCLNLGCDADRAIRGFVQTTAQRDGIFIGEPTGMYPFFVVPRGMEEIVDYFKNRYHNKPMYITENGYSSPKQLEHDDLQDDVKRVQYYKAYLASLARAMRNGADVRGYFVWTLMDDFEWDNGYGVKFGLYSVDPVTLNRSPRLSAKWYEDFLRNKSHTGTEQEAPTLLNNKDELKSIDINDERTEM